MHRRSNHWAGLAFAVGLLCTIFLSLSPSQAVAGLSEVLAAREAKAGASSDNEIASKELDALTDAATSDPSQVDTILARLSDEQVRTLLIEELKQDAAAQMAKEQAAPPSFEDHVLHAGKRLKQNIHRAAEALPKLPDELHAAYQTLKGEHPRADVAWYAMLPVIILGVAWAGQFFIVRRIQAARSNATKDYYPNQAMPWHRRVLAQCVVTITGMLAFVVLAVLCYSMVTDSGHTAAPITSNLALTGLYLYLAWNVFTTLLSPRDGSMRLLPVGDVAAKAIMRVGMGIVALIILRMHVIALFVSTGMSIEGLTLLQGMIGLVGLAFLLGSILWHRRSVSEWILSRSGETPSILSRQFAAVWHMLAMLYLLLIAVVGYTLLLLEGYEGPRGVFVTGLLALPAFVILDKACQALLRLAFGMFQATPHDTATPPKLDDEGHPTGEATVTIAPPPPDVRTMKLFIPARVIMRIGLTIFTTLAVFWAWGVEIPYLEVVVEHTLRIMLILAAGLGLWELARGLIQRSLATTNEAEQNNPRFKTLLPLLQKVMGVFLLLTTALMLLSQLGVQIGPLLAGAGVFGLAIGMGSQTLVKDIVAGFFFLVEDAFRVGDYIKMGSTEGYVIKMSVRNLTLQHYLGYVQLLPYGDVSGVVNFSRNPITMKIKIPLPMDTDPKLFKKICKKVNEALMEDPEYKDDLVEPVKSQGVKRIQDSVMIFGIKFMAKPGKQFSIRKQIYALLFKQFKKHGLRFAAPGVTVFSSGQGGEEDSQAAAAAAVQQQAKATQAGQGGEGGR